MSNAELGLLLGRVLAVLVHILLLAACLAHMRDHNKEE